MRENFTTNNKLLKENDQLKQEVLNLKVSESYVLS